LVSAKLADEARPSHDSIICMVDLTKANAASRHALPGFTTTLAK
jgi:hypothetical protein